MERLEVIRNYYNNDNVNNVYRYVWGGDDIHVGIYENDDTDIRKASQAASEYLVSFLNLQKEQCVLDLGAGYGGLARIIAKKFGSSVDCLNLSTKQNDENQRRNQETKLNHLVKVYEGNFESPPFEDNKYDAIVSEDSICHSENKQLVFDSVYRLLKPGKNFVLSDTTENNMPQELRQKIAVRTNNSAHHLSSNLYIDLAKQSGLELEKYEDLSEHMSRHYSAVALELEKRYSELQEFCSREFLDVSISGTKFRSECVKQGYLKWGIFRFCKPS